MSLLRMSTSTVREEEEDCEWETDDEGDEAAPADQLVLVEIIGTFTDDLVRDPDLRVKFIGLDTARPMVQLGNQGIDSTVVELYSQKICLSLDRPCCAVYCEFEAESFAQ